MLWIVSSNQACIHCMWKLIVNQLPAIWVIFWGRSYGGQCVRVRPYPYTLRCLFPIPYCLPCPTLPRHLAYADYAMPYHAWAAIMCWLCHAPYICIAGHAYLIVAYQKLISLLSTKFLHPSKWFAISVTTKEKALTQREWEHDRSRYR